MSKIHLNPAAEKEANDIGKMFMNSTDVVGDMSRAYGTDLSSVKIHTDDGAARQAAERGVDAFSTGRDVFFGRDAFNQNDPASRGLLAHELSHSLQQGVGGEMSGMSQSAPMGAAQGGLLDWFRSKKWKNTFSPKRKRNKDLEKEISGMEISDVNPELDLQNEHNAEAANALNDRSAGKKLYGDAKFGADGFDDNADEIRRGYILPKSMTAYGNTTRFSTKEARDLYVSVQNDPELLKDPAVRAQLTEYYKTEAPAAFKPFQEGKETRQNFSTEVLRGQRSGAMRIMGSLMQYHAGAGNMVDEMLANYQAGEQDVSPQYYQMSDAVEGNEELMNLLQLHSDTLLNSGAFQKGAFIDQEGALGADAQAMNDFVLRGLNPLIMGKTNVQGISPEERKKVLGMSATIQRQANQANTRGAGASRFFTLLARRRKGTK